MKLAVSVLSVFLLVTGLGAFRIPATGSGEFAKDLQDFLDLIPLERASELVRAYLAKDKEFQAAIEILYSKELYQYTMDLEAAPEYAELFSFMQGAGLDGYYILKRINELLTDHQLPSAVVAPDIPISGGLLGFVVDMNSLIPAEKAVALFNEKIAAGGKFTEYYVISYSPRFLEFYKRLANNVHYQILIREAEKKNVNTVLFQLLFTTLMIVRLVVA
ncbi:protein G12-like [Augochlora pura]